MIQEREECFRGGNGCAEATELRDEQDLGQPYQGSGTSKALLPEPAASTALVADGL